MATYLERRGEGWRNLERYFVISEYFGCHPERISGNRDYISEVMFHVLDSHKKFRVGSEAEIKWLMRNFGITDIVGDEEEARFVFRE